jgi:hypothetical protein
LKQVEIGMAKICKKIEEKEKKNSWQADQK